MELIRTGCPPSLYALVRFTFSYMRRRVERSWGLGLVGIFEDLNQNLPAARKNLRKFACLNSDGETLVVGQKRQRYAET